MKVLVLGATGHLGLRLIDMLSNTSWAEPVGASRGRNPAAPGRHMRQVDTRDSASLTDALRGCDAVVNCVAGSARVISEGAQLLVQACRDAACARIVHMSTMSVYGSAEGLISENAPLDPGLGWYGRAKCEAETHVSDFVRAGGQAVVLRPGCVFGPGSELWVGRTGRWLHSGRLGALGLGGDGWSNLVHVDDVCRAVVAALRLPLAPHQTAAFNLAAPDSPRWNDYFVDLALATGATPVPQLSRRQLLLDAWLAGPPLKMAERLTKHLGVSAQGLPDPLPPGLLRLWQQHIRLDPGAATRELRLTWMPYAEGLHSSAAWFLKQHRPARGPVEDPLANALTGDPPAHPVSNGGWPGPHPPAAAPPGNQASSAPERRQPQSP